MSAKVISSSLITMIYLLISDRLLWLFNTILSVYASILRLEVLEIFAIDNMFTLSDPVSPNLTIAVQFIIIIGTVFATNVSFIHAL